MQGDENRVRYWFVLLQQQRDEYLSLRLNNEDISYASSHGSQRGLRFGDRAGKFKGPHFHFSVQ
jgi:hypothetical protein